MSAIRPTQLTVEYETSPPLGLDTPRPVLGWQSVGEGYGLVQRGYRISVASNPERLTESPADMWDTGYVESDRSSGIAYRGKPLESGTRYYWRVRVWDGDRCASGWSAVHSWTTGLFRGEDWQASWIGNKAYAHPGPAPLLRKLFYLDDGRSVESAFLFATALGVYRIRINGKDAGDGRLTPGWSDYRSHVRYQTYDVKHLLQEGANAIGATLGSGWYAGHIASFGSGHYGNTPALLAQLVIRYSDGKLLRIVTDETWKAADGPIREADLIHGETYDARLLQAGWDGPEFEDRHWNNADVLPAYSGTLKADIQPPNRITEDIIPVSVKKAGDGRYIFDMGQNMVGHVLLKTKGPAGARIQLRFAEMLTGSGEFYTDNLRAAKQTDVYILRGEGEERYEPSFTIHGFRYVEMTGYSGTPQLDSILGRVVHSDMRRTAEIETSDPYVNKLAANIIWGQRGNFVSVPTDCPQRDERLGWTGDVQIFARTASYNMLTRNFYKSWLEDLRACQMSSGAIPDVVPDVDAFHDWVRTIGMKGHGTAGWGDAAVIVPWTMYLVYGDRTTLCESYDSMTKWMEYLAANSVNGLRPEEGYGDWLSVRANTPRDVLATAYYAYCAKVMGNIAAALDRTEDRDRYSRLFGEISAAFADAYISPDGKIKGDTQTAYVLALTMGLAPENLRQRMAGHLAADIISRGTHLSTGFLGVGYLLPVLSEHGHHELACRVLQQMDYPSWLYSIKHGATTIWERWDGWTEEAGFQDERMNSFNHYSLGSVGEWLYRYLLGIDLVESDPAFRTVRIQPRPGGTITRASGVFRSIHGDISVEWCIREGRFECSLRIPVNVNATVHLPGRLEDISESGYSILRSRMSEVSGILCAESEQAGTTLRIGSGSYFFCVPWNECSAPR